ncbi:MAG: UvrD-helicase domain-containing protein, partial [Eubacteriales bacterium]|nr:UvrD-helicase domain-containing protein [Eubacteriales bacterium]
MPNDCAYTLHRKMCLDRLYSGLNPMQREAVCTVRGPLLVLAGAGSGKTTVLVNRIYHIINFGDICSDERPPISVELKTEKMKAALNGGKKELENCLKSMAVNPALPESVLCITFTNKAAGEFKQRLEAMLGDSAKAIWAGTFHSICVRILRKYIGLIGFSNSFTIYDADDSKKLITQIMKDLRVDEKILPVKAVAGAISGHKESRVLPEEASVNAYDMRSRQTAEIYAEYQKRLKSASALDFDDIILNTLILFEENPEVLDYYRRKFEYILVDEYQDTNPSQNDLVVMLGRGRRNVCVVGDDDQSIYSSRGATVDNILNFARSFHDAKTIKLEQNYRSTKTILTAANAVISNNKGRKGKNLWTSGAEGEKITKRCLYTQNEEADYICGEIMKLHAFGVSLKSIAVLYRMNAVSNSLETAFVKNRLPYKVFGGIRFYERKEIKDIVAYLSIISNKNDNIRLRRIINVPKRQIGNSTVEALAAVAERDGISMLEAAKASSEYPELARSYPRLEKFYALIADLADFAKENSVSALINEVISRTGYET